MGDGRIDGAVVNLSRWGSVQRGGLESMTVGKLNGVAQRLVSAKSKTVALRTGVDIRVVRTCHNFCDFCGAGRLALLVD